MMNERWVDNAGNELPRPGDVAWFIHLHLDDEVVELSRHPSKEDWRIYRVAGKRRPMVVLFRLSKCRRKRRWFRVLPITTKGRDESGKVLADFEFIGRCIDPDKDSFVDLDACDLPDNMLCRSGGRPLVREPFNKLAFDAAIKIVSFKAAGRWKKGLTPMSDRFGSRNAPHEKEA